MDEPTIAERTANPDRVPDPAPLAFDTPPPGGVSTADGVPATRLSPQLHPEAAAVRRLLRTLRRLVEGLYHHDGLSAGPAMVFHFFLSLLPLLVVVGWVLGRIARSHGVEVLFDPIFETAPTAVATIGRRELERLAQSDLSAAPLAVVGFLWLASSGVHGMMDAFERALAVPVRRPYWKKRLYSLAFVFLGLSATAVVAFAVVGVESIVSVARQMSDPEEAGASVPTPAPIEAGAPTSDRGATGATTTTAPVPSREPSRRPRARVGRVLAIVCFLALSVSGVAVFYRFAVEYPANLRRRVWPGAVLAIALWLVISWAFGFYVTSLGQYTLYYGSLAAVAVLLMWFWLTSLALLIGAELNAQLEGSRI